MRNIIDLKLTDGCYWYIPHITLSDGTLWTTPQMVHIQENRMLMFGECHNVTNSVEEKAKFIDPIKFIIGEFDEYLPKVHHFIVENENIS